MLIYWSFSSYSASSISSSNSSFYSFILQLLLLVLLYTTYLISSAFFPQFFFIFLFFWFFFLFSSIYCLYLVNHVLHLLFALLALHAFHASSFVLSFPLLFLFILFFCHFLFFLLFTFFSFLPFFPYFVPILLSPFSLLYCCLVSCQSPQARTGHPVFRLPRQPELARPCIRCDGVQLAGERRKSCVFEGGASKSHQPVSELHVFRIHHFGGARFPCLCLPNMCPSSRPRRATTDRWLSPSIRSLFPFFSFSLFQYVRLSDEDKLEDIMTLMKDHWRMMEPLPPGLCISVIGGAKNFQLTGRSKETFNHASSPFLKMLMSTGQFA
ncbi:unnamed protein product [Protopolystoma xenopodis]|uniref:TRPM SLOG domain-containing protein n=1 Tax=Protopolystoma xenopodis TaxID=117903 RepID=A0A3S5CLX4_9PLAT|nr:unnamed protein product [Protopolystoma xenopodis]